MSALTRLEAKLGYHFPQPETLRQALTHRSHSSPHNERLEFLGDSVLNCAIAGMLYGRFPGLREGELSRLRASLVRQETLAEIAAGLELGEALRLGEGELKSGGYRRPSILADALEAVFGAIFLDGGFAAAAGVIDALYRSRIEQIDPRHTGKDAKTTLQEWLQARRLPIPQYSLLKTEGEGHLQRFEVACSVPSHDLTVVGAGASRRGAEQQAATLVLERLKEQ